MSMSLFIDYCIDSSCYVKTYYAGAWMEMVSLCQEDAEMVAMDSSSNKTFIDGVSKGYPVWIRGTNLRWIWDRGYKTYSYYGVKILSVT